jgi:hypothetical protein
MRFLGLAGGAGDLDLYLFRGLHDLDRLGIGEGMAFDQHVDEALGQEEEPPDRAHQVRRSPGNRRNS